MPTVYVLNVPEFAGLAKSVRASDGYRVRDSGRGYTIIESDDELVFNRAATGFKPAVWYGAFTGGIRGTITEFGRDTVRIVNIVDEA